MNKKHIIDEIQRMAGENGGKPLGQARFQEETGIGKTDWYGKHWARWGDAVLEAGFEPNKLQGSFSEEFLLDELVALTRELGRFPVTGELRLRKKTHPNFPSHTVFRRLGRKSELLSRVVRRCDEIGGLDDVRKACLVAAQKVPVQYPEEVSSETKVGFVYLMRSGRYYKIGYSNAPGRREYELALQLPEEITRVHVIRTDDPPGIEEYWHRRFESRRKNGEWFELTAKDVRAFKSRRTM